MRGQRWWRLKDPIRLKFWQFGEEEYFLWSQLEAGVSLEELQRRFADVSRRVALNCRNCISSLERSTAKGLVFSTAPRQADILLDRDDRQRSQRRFQWLTNLLAIRFRGLDPTRLLEWLHPRVAWLFTPWSLLAFGLLVLSAVLLAGCELETILARLPRASEFLTAHQPGMVGRDLGGRESLSRIGARAHLPTFRWPLSRTWRDAAGLYALSLLQRLGRMVASQPLATHGHQRGGDVRRNGLGRRRHLALVVQRARPVLHAVLECDGHRIGQHLAVQWQSAVAIRRLLLAERLSGSAQSAAGQRRMAAGLAWPRADSASSRPRVPSSPADRPSFFRPMRWQRPLTAGF